MHARYQLFSAYAEVFPKMSFDVKGSTAFLCLRRGVSPIAFRKLTASIFSLPTQRCFSVKDDVLVDSPLFSAYAEVFLIPAPIRKMLKAFLCLRRGVSKRKASIYPFPYFSLPTQRCFFRSVQSRQRPRLFS